MSGGPGMHDAVISQASKIDIPGTYPRGTRVRSRLTGVDGTVDGHTRLKVRVLWDGRRRTALHYPTHLMMGGKDPAPRQQMHGGANIVQRRAEVYQRMPVDMKKEYLSLDDMLVLLAGVTARTASLMEEAVRTNDWLACRRRDGSLRR